jgi:demethylspheroidene O-methyltransferase
VAFFSLPQRMLPASSERLGFWARMALSPRFHRLVERTPGLRRFSRAEGRALFSILSGFVQAQTLFAVVELRILHRLKEGGATTEALATLTQVPLARMKVLMQAAAALKLVCLRQGRWHLTPRGAAFLTVPGLEAMVSHHHVLYSDLSDPVAFFRGETTPELAGFWPYVFGTLAQTDAALAGRYSTLMTESQALVAEDTLRMVDFSDQKHLLDIGGGTGAFLRAVGRRYPDLSLTLFDLPDVLTSSEPPRDGIARVAGSFRSEALPTSADVISLVRVLYDHSDDVVRALLEKVYSALPSGGRLVISEPMSGGHQPDPATDVYFAIYTMAMHTGRTRSQLEIANLLKDAGFSVSYLRSAPRPFITSVVEARKV